MTTDLAAKLRQAYHNDLTDVPLLLDAAGKIEDQAAEIDSQRELMLNLQAEIGRMTEDLTSRNHLLLIDTHLIATRNYNLLIEIADALGVGGGDE
jgi:hypothetical protein